MKRSKSLSYKGKRHTPLPTGQYTVGCTDIMSCSKSGVFFRLFYPAENTGDREHFCEWPLWVPNKQYVDGYARKVGVCRALFRLCFSLVIGDVYVPALWNTGIAKHERKFPVVVFSHGLGAWRCAYSTICLELASHGFVVAAVEHRDQSAAASQYRRQARMSVCGEFPGSSLGDIDEILERHSESEWNSAFVDEWDPKPSAQSIGPCSYTKEWMYYLRVKKNERQCVRKSQLKKRAHECIQTLDCLESLNNGKLINILEPHCMEPQFFGRLDLSKVAIIGHSFGGATVMLSLGMDSRFRIGIALDPWMFPFYEDNTAFSYINQPLLTVNTSTFQTKRCLMVMEELLKSDAERMFFSVKKSNHRDQSDLPFVKRPLLSLGVSSHKFNIIDVSLRLTLDFLQKHLGLTATCTELDRNWYKSKCNSVF